MQEAQVKYGAHVIVRMKESFEKFFEYFCSDEDYYPKKFVVYFMREIPSIINILSHFKGCTEEVLMRGYTEETYLNMIEESIEQLKKLCNEFVYSLGK